MRHPRRTKGLPLSLQYIANWEGKVLRQNQLIARLKNKGQCTREAEVILVGYEATLAKLRNHWATMQLLTAPSFEQNQKTESF